MVNLTRIYTRTGDAGRTRLSDMSWAEKTDARVEAYGTVDEANSIIGLALATGGTPDDVAAVLRQVQNELFDLGADLSTPLVADPEWPPLRIEQESIDRLEAWCDAFGESLPDLKSFILPGGSPAGAHLHQARTVVRRAERCAWVAVQAYGTDEVPAPARRAGGAEDPDQDADEAAAIEPPAAGGVNMLAVTYLNRLSDLLFILTRVVNGTAHETMWVPGGERHPMDPRGIQQRRRIDSAARDRTQDSPGQ